jgi:hypothetical protein
LELRVEHEFEEETFALHELDVDVLGQGEQLKEGATTAHLRLPFPDFATLCDYHCQLGLYELVLLCVEVYLLDA